LSVSKNRRDRFPFLSDGNSLIVHCMAFRARAFTNISQEIIADFVRFRLDSAVIRGLKALIGRGVPCGGQAILSRAGARRGSMFAMHRTLKS
jgi:hypothetical protein